MSRIYCNMNNDHFLSNTEMKNCSTPFCSLLDDIYLMHDEWNSNIEDPKELKNKPVVVQDDNSKEQEHNKTVIKVTTLKRKTLKIENCEIAKKKKYSKNKIRSHLPKRCGDSSCQHGQYYETSEEAARRVETFNTTKYKSTLCTCGKTVQYFIDGIWLRSGGLSKHESKKKLNKS
eukprot:gene5935-9765_t